MFDTELSPITAAIAISASGTNPGACRPVVLRMPPTIRPTPSTASASDAIRAGVNHSTPASAAALAPVATSAPPRRGSPTSWASAAWSARAVGRGGWLGQVPRELRGAQRIPCGRTGSAVTGGSVDAGDGPAFTEEPPGALLMSTLGLAPDSSSPDVAHRSRRRRHQTWECLWH